MTVQFWTLLGRVHTMTQAKRLYGFIGAGAVLGAVVGAGLGRAALAILPARTLLLEAEPGQPLQPGEGWRVELSVRAQG